MNSRPEEATPPEDAALYRPAPFSKARFPTLFEVTLGESGHYGAKILCPVCGFEYTHTTGRTEKARSDDYEAWNGRGSAFAVEMEGECGHLFSLVLGFHKGETFLTVSMGWGQRP